MKLIVDRRRRRRAVYFYCRWFRCGIAFDLNKIPRFGLKRFRRYREFAIWKLFLSFERECSDRLGSI